MILEIETISRRDNNELIEKSLLILPGLHPKTLKRGEAD
jgi:hypothetical protein